MLIQQQSIRFNKPGSNALGSLRHWCACADKGSVGTIGSEEQIGSVGMRMNEKDHTIPPRPSYV
jgi:hypothetical protein